MGLFEKTRRRLSSLGLRRTRSAGDIDDSATTQSDDNQQDENKSRRTSYSSSTERRKGILIHPHQNAERPPTPPSTSTNNDDDCSQELSDQLGGIEADNMEMLLTYETQTRMEHLDKKSKRHSKITFAPPPPRPRSPEPEKVVDRRRFSVPNFLALRRFSSNDDSSSIVVGSRVKLVKRPIPITGMVRYVGQPPGESEDWLGVEFDSAVGTTDGKFNGTRYFQTSYNSALFVKKSDVAKL